MKTKDNIETDGTIYANDIQFKRGKQGQILYRDRDKWRKLNPGTPGQFLKTQGENANPVWDNVDGCICVTGTYAGDGNPSGQQITNVVPEGYIIQYIHIFGKWTSGDNIVIHNAWKTNTMYGSEAWTKNMDVTIPPGQVGIMPDETILLNQPVRGFTVSGNSNDSRCSIYHFMVIASIIPE
jgi:hypothetical protein